jgi:hypothetical protein
MPSDFTGENSQNHTKEEKGPHSFTTQMRPSSLPHNLLREGGNGADQGKQRLPIQKTTN